MRDKDHIISAYGVMASTREGQIVLEDLRGQFMNRNLVGQTEVDTLKRAAQHDVVHYINTMIEVANNG